ncbi:MAG TPA: hypothetical protein VLI04_20565 [Nocardioidaceae bacterium]|nr:hypothetical protein [Nocardioidaceae bacterium]
MNKSTTLRTTMAAAVAAAGLTVGGIGLASAADSDAASNRSSTPSHPDRGGPGHHEANGEHGPEGAALAEALGVTEDELTAAFEAVRDELTPPDFDRDSPPTEAEMDERRAAFAAALAKALDLDEADVAAALEGLHEEREAEARTALSDRLDDAVTAGDLTAADKASVLKAFDAGVLAPSGHGRP